jgi:hypothetical protein
MPIEFDGEILGKSFTGNYGMAGVYQQVTATR